MHSISQQKVAAKEFQVDSEVEDGTKMVENGKVVR